MSSMYRAGTTSSSQQQTSAKQVLGVYGRRTFSFSTNFSCCDNRSFAFLVLITAYVAPGIDLRPNKNAARCPVLNLRPCIDREFAFSQLSHPQKILFLYPYRVANGASLPQ